MARIAPLVAFLLLLGVPPASAATPCISELAQCRQALFFDDDVVAADDCFEQHLTDAPPCDQDAAAFRAVTRILRLAEDPNDPPGLNNSWHELLDRFGFAQDGRSIYALHLRLPRNLDGPIDLPGGSPTGTDIQETIETLALVDAIDASIAQLEAIHTDHVSYISPSELAAIGAGRYWYLEIDQSDRRAAIGALHVLEAGLLHSLAYDLELELDQYTPFQYTTSIQTDIIDAHPLLLTPTLGACAALTDAKAELDEGIDHLQLAWQSVQFENDAQYDDFITLSCGPYPPKGPLHCQHQAEYQAHAGVLQDSLHGRTRILNLGSPRERSWTETLNRVVGTGFPTSGPDQGASADLSLLFGCNPLFSPRDGDRLPVVLFDVAEDPTNFIHRESFVDKTFGGILLPVPEPSATQLTVPGLLTLLALARARRRGRAERV